MTEYDSLTFEALEGGKSYTRTEIEAKLPCPIDWPEDIQKITLPPGEYRILQFADGKTTIHKIG